MKKVWKQREQDGAENIEKKRLVTPHSFWRFIGILISASLMKKGGYNLWEKEDGSVRKISKPINFGPSGGDLMPGYRHEELRKAFSYAFNDSESDSDWARIGLLIDGYNENRKRKIASSLRKVLDESMSALVPRTTATGGLPNISFICRKPEPLGTEFKVSFVANLL